MYTDLARAVKLRALQFVNVVVSSASPHPVWIVVYTEDEIEVTEACGTLLAKAARFTDERRGVLCVWRAGRTGPWDQSDRYLLGEIAAQIGQAGRPLKT